MRSGGLANQGGDSGGQAGDVALLAVEQPLRERHLLTTGMGGYTRSGVINRPSLATAEKGKALLASLVESFASVLEILRRGSPAD